MPDHISITNILDALKKLSRYDCEDVGCMGGWNTLAEMVEHGDGDYVKWKDVQDLIDNLSLT